MKTLAPHTWRSPLVWLACLPFLVAGARAGTITVTSNADSGEGSLRAALEAAANGDVIEVPVTGSINLQSSLVVNRAVSIRGPGSTSLKVRRGEGVEAKFGVFEVRSGGVSISRFTITDGIRSEGGGIFRQSGGSLLIEDCLLIGNRQEGNGYGGGAIALRGDGNTVIRGCVILENTVADGSLQTAHAGGGGVLLGSGSLLLENSSLVGNTAKLYGGGLYLTGGTADVRNCTFSGNKAPRSGSALGASGGTLNLLGCTITENQPGAAYLIGGKLTIGNSILAGNGSGVDFVSARSLTSLGYNLVGSPGNARFTAPGDVTGVAQPLLAPLGYYGGSTLIHPPTFNSVHVVDKGKASFGDLDLATDQHGRPRRVRAHWQEPAAGGDFSDIGAVELWEMPQTASEVVVNATDDNDDGVPGRLHCSLREAITHVNGTVKGERIIRFDNRVFGPGKPQRTIVLSKVLPALDNIKLLGPGAKHLTIQAADRTRLPILHLGGTERCTVTGLTLAKGSHFSGGGIYATVPLTLENCHIRDCNVSDEGGGLFCKAGGLIMKGCTFSNNTAANGGAGISIIGEIPSTIENSTFDNNRATGGFGGGIQASGEVTITACTLTRGYAARAGSGIAVRLNSPGTAIILKNCIVSGNEGADVCASGRLGDPGIGSGGYNLIGKRLYHSDFTDGVNGDQVGVTVPRLGVLRNNGGPTPTLALLADSPAIDRGMAFGLTTDQRGFARTFDYPYVHSANEGDRTDVGAFELQRFSFEDWRVNHFTPEQLAGSASQPGGDANASGIANSLKHLFGIDPLAPVDAGSLAALPSASTAQETGRKYFVLTYRRSGLYSGPEETVEYSTDLSEWRPAPRYRTRIGPADSDSFDQKVEVWVDMSGVGNAYFRVATPD